MYVKRRVDGFNLSFLDVMACGLGAVILLFMLVKFNVEQKNSSDEELRLSKEIALSTEQLNQLKASLSAKELSVIAQQEALNQLAISKVQTEQALSDASQGIANQQALITKLEQEVKQAPADAPVELAGTGNEEYLLGLKVEGANIGILLDASASMTDELLVEIIKRKIEDDKTKQQAPKWQRSIRVVNWLLANAPKSSNISLVSFNKSAQLVGSEKTIKTNDAEALTQVSKALTQVVPEHGTNLQAALHKIVEVNPKLSSLYIITDGLPTLGNKGSWISGFSKCGSFFGKSSTITGECREQLFFQSVKTSRLPNIPVNIVLMPLEGDPQAAPAFWQWTNNSGGLLISPAPSWP